MKVNLRLKFFSNDLFYYGIYMRSRLFFYVPYVFILVLRIYLGL